MSTNVSTGTRPEALKAPAASYGGPLAILTTLFFLWGSLTSLNDVLIPYAQHVFEPPGSYAGLQFAGHCGVPFCWGSRDTRHDNQCHRAEHVAASQCHYPSLRVFLCCGIVPAGGRLCDVETP